MFIPRITAERVKGKQTQKREGPTCLLPVDPFQSRTSPRAREHGSTPDKASGACPQWPLVREQDKEPFAGLETMHSIEHLDFSTREIERRDLDQQCPFISFIFFDEDVIPPLLTTSFFRSFSMILISMMHATTGTKKNVEIY